MEVRECENCGAKDYAGGRISRRTVEYVSDDGETVWAADWSLCADCAERIRFADHTCPYCLDNLLRDENPADCPDAPADAPDPA